MELNQQIEFYPKGKKYGKKFTGIIVGIYLDVIHIKLEDVVYCIKQKSKHNYIVE